MRKKLVIDKRVGQTPLQAIAEWKRSHPSYSDIPASYAGRLDPMASGKLLILLGDECKRQKEYIGLDKSYDVEVLLDIGSDTGDVLGIASSSGACTIPTPNALQAALRKELGTKEVPYPAFSSKTVHGKPLFLYALEGSLGSIDTPTHAETIYRIRMRSTRTVASHDLAQRVHSLLSLAPRSEEPSKALGADFRIKEVQESWEKILTEERSYCIISIRVSCASGTYMRSLAGRIGAALGTSALALSIHRRRIGRDWLGRI